jgi:serine/threonine protein kinase
VNERSDRVSESSDPLVGRILDDRYHVLHRIGKGGMGSVYLAEHVLIRRKVAIKTLHPSLSERPDVVQRFHREAVAAAAVGSEHIVRVTDMGQLDNGDYFIVLEHLQGADLAWVVASEGRLSIARSLRIVSQLCDALSAVHAAGIVHRDLKPENLFLIEREGVRDFVKVFDFGVCKIHDVDAPAQRRLTDTGVTLGTPHFMAPEQIEASPDIDRRADLYAVAGILHFLLIGDPPFDAPTIPRLLMRICYEPPPRLRALRPGISRSLERVVARGLAKSPDQRYPDAAALKQALAPLLAAAERTEQEHPSEARPTLASPGVRPQRADAVVNQRTPTVPSNPDQRFHPAGDSSESLRVRRQRLPTVLTLSALLIAISALIAWRTWSAPDPPAKAPPKAHLARPAPPAPSALHLQLDTLEPPPQNPRLDLAGRVLPPAAATAQERTEGAVTTDLERTAGAAPPEPDRAPTRGVRLQPNPLPASGMRTVAPRKQAPPGPLDLPADARAEPPPSPSPPVPAADSGKRHLPAQRDIIRVFEQSDEPSR